MKIPKISKYRFFIYVDGKGYYVNTAIITLDFNGATRLFFYFDISRILFFEMCLNMIKRMSQGLNTEH